MTPEEIVKQFATTIVISPPRAIKAKIDAIEAIKQYAREMCDKQKTICSLDAERSDWNNIANAPYPEELQN